MQDLLVDNISLLKRLDALGQQYTIPTLPGVLKPRFREITFLVSWLYCFLAYVAMRTTDPFTTQMLAYGCLLVRKAQHHDGFGWLDYDHVFRQQAAINPSMPWNRLHTDIQGTTILGRSSGKATFCTYCFESDHVPGQCALNYFEQPGTPSSSLGHPHLGTGRSPTLGVARSLFCRYVSHGTRAGVSILGPALTAISVLYATINIWPATVPIYWRTLSTGNPHTVPHALPPTWLDLLLVLLPEGDPPPLLLR